MDKIRYTEYSDRFVGLNNTELAVTVQIPDEMVNDLDEILLIIQEPKLIKLTLGEFQTIEEHVYQALKEAGWKEERAGDGVEPG